MIHDCELGIKVRDKWPQIAVPPGVATKIGNAKLKVALHAT